ncbi:rRNA maturation RNase YbeY [Magnetovibrio blakemorei]|uniref:Endoribonuclease YbeY n=1 Tax=Magnetovibrio blakemorei TaxID=28181 RepID=A0A1E5Q3M5_9PROT|nr:rRNA maturation RNase YbeY [Magnetovibrio blakemorei]OEJ64319.1 rRNA maturation RNase YbeY [Magnetovibrio blakemorei]
MNPTSHLAPTPDLWIDIAVDAGGWSEALPDFDKRCRVAITAAVAAGAEVEDEDEAQWEISVLLTNDAAVQVMNKNWRAQDKPTNVLSFAAPPSDDLPDGAPMLLGDIVLAFETLVQEAQEQGKPLADHFSHLMVHGMLHLLGFDHESEAQAQEMEPLEVSILAGLGISSPYEDKD